MSNDYVLSVCMSGSIKNSEYK